jgi:chromosome segregation ATPase
VFRNESFSTAFMRLTEVNEKVIGDNEILREKIKEMMLKNNDLVFKNRDLKATIEQMTPKMPPSNLV